MGRYLRQIRLDSQPEGYLAELPVVRSLMASQGLRFQSNITFFVGENGTGKSTLIEAMAVLLGFNPEGGTWNFSFSTCESHSQLYQHLKAVRGTKRPKDGFFLRAESFYNAASYIDQVNKIPFHGPPLIDSYGGTSLHKQSHGESFLALARNRFGGQGLYLLDEPEAALSPTGQMALMLEFQRLLEQDSQLIIATHSPILLTFPGAEIFQLTPEGIQRVSYQETLHYQLTRSFLENPQRMLNYLFAEDGEEQP